MLWLTRWRAHSKDFGGGEMQAVVRGLKWIRNDESVLHLDTHVAENMPENPGVDDNWRGSLWRCMDWRNNP